MSPECGFASQDSSRSLVTTTASDVSTLRRSQIPLSLIGLRWITSQSDWTFCFKISMVARTTIPSLTENSEPTRLQKNLLIIKLERRGGGRIEAGPRSELRKWLATTSRRERSLSDVSRSAESEAIVSRGGGPRRDCEPRAGMSRGDESKTDESKGGESKAGVSREDGSGAANLYLGSQ